MIVTKEGDVVIHKQVWETVLADEHYREIAEEIEDLEDHYEALKDSERIPFTEYLKNRKENV